MNIQVSTIYRQMSVEYTLHSCAHCACVCMCVCANAALNVMHIFVICD